MEDSNTKKRLAQFLEYLKIGQAKFAENIGVSRGFANNIGDSIRRENLEKIARVYPILNISWLLTGEGPMLKGSSGHNYGSTDCQTVLLIPIKYAGISLKEISSMSKMTSGFEYIISPVKDVDYAIEIADNSMSPEYPLGSKVLIRKIADPSILEWGKVYAIDTPNGVIIKEIRPSVKKNRIKCTSINHDQDKYSPFEIDITQSISIYKVVMVISLK